MKRSKLKNIITVKIKYDSIEKVLSLLKGKKIKIVNLKTDNTQEGVIHEITCIREDEGILLKILSRNHIEVVNVEFSGSKIVFDYLWRNKIIWLFYILGITVFYILSQDIWSIKVMGNKYINTEEILEFMEENQIKKGTSKKKINTATLKNLMHIRFKNIAFVSFDICGTNLLIKVIDYENIERSTNINASSDIVSTKTAIVKNIVACKGEKVASIGDMVGRGQLLISGYLKDAEGEPIGYVNADGKVVGEVSYNITGIKELKKEIKYYTNKRHREIEINYIKDNNIKRYIFFEYEDDYVNYEKYQKRLTLLNVMFCLNTYEEYYINTQRLDISKAKTELKRSIIASVTNKSNKIYEVLENQVQIKQDGDRLWCLGGIKVLEDIGEKIYVK